jgi:hypothetical protein
MAAPGRLGDAAMVLALFDIYAHKSEVLPGRRDRGEARGI